MGILATFVGAGAEPLEVELNCDNSLHYKHVIDAIIAVSGYMEGGEVFHLIERIKFLSPDQT